VSGVGSIDPFVRVQVSGGKGSRAPQIKYSAPMRAVSGWKRGLGQRGAAIALLVAVSACIIETEPGPTRPPLRDTLRTRAAASASATPSPEIAPVVVAPIVVAPVPDAYRACDSDADCVAVLPNGCCHDGRNEALNKSLVDAYRSTFRCATEHPQCPTNLVLDRRAAACDVARHLCKLVEGS